MPWVARMEQELESRGIYEEFVDAIEAETGKDWTEARKDAMFVRSDMETALVQVSEDFRTRRKLAGRLRTSRRTWSSRPPRLLTKSLNTSSSAKPKPGKTVGTSSLSTKSRSLSVTTASVSSSSRASSRSSGKGQRKAVPRRHLAGTASGTHPGCPRTGSGGVEGYRPLPSPIRPRFRQS